MHPIIVPCLSNTPCVCVCVRNKLGQLTRVVVYAQLFFPLLLPSCPSMGLCGPSKEEHAGLEEGQVSVGYRVAVAIAVAILPEPEDAFHACFVRRERTLAGLTRQLEVNGFMSGKDDDVRTMPPGTLEFDMARDIVASEANEFDEVTRVRVVKSLGLCESMELFVREWKKVYSVAKISLETATLARMTHEERVRQSRVQPRHHQAY